MCLPGNRLNFVFNSRSLHPLEHLPEPDNRVDLNDLPTASIDRVYNIDGPLGMILGGENAISSIFLIPLRPDTTQAKSRLVVDKGSFGYANTKVLFARRLLGGQSFRAGIEYRRTDGLTSGRDDNSYHQWGEILYPVSERIRLDLSGRLYNRTGSYTVQPDISSFSINRNRRDRDLTAGFDFYNSPGRTTRVEFRHQRSESALDEYTALYKRNIDFLDNSFCITHDSKLGKANLKASIKLTREEFNDSEFKERRFGGGFEARIVSGGDSHPAAAIVRVEKVDGFGVAFSGAMGYTVNTPTHYLSASAGYVTKIPRQYELRLVPRMTGILAGDNADYYESGNPSLKSEKQMTGNLTVGIGQAGSDLLLSATGGKIIDGIDWQSKDSDTLGNAVEAFKPENRDITFSTASIKKRFSFGEMLHWSAGGSWHYIKEDSIAGPPYSPHYQLFSGLEIYNHVQKLDLHLYGYIECTYVGPYYGPLGTKLGEKPIINMKLSFRIKSFRFYYIFQDLASLEYQSRENYTIPGRFNYYGIIWEFLD